MTNLYTYEGVAQILRTEEKNGRLRENTYSASSGVLKLSQEMKTIRNNIKHTKKDARGELRLELHLLQEKYRIATEKEFERIAKELVTKKERFYWMLEKKYIFDFFKNVDKDGLFAF